jgi:hypothetical protein
LKLGQRLVELDGRLHRVAAYVKNDISGQNAAFSRHASRIKFAKKPGFETI